MKKRFLGFILIALIAIIGLVSCTIPASLIVYNNLYHNTIGVYIDGSYELNVGAGSSGKITGITPGTHSLKAITIGPTNWGTYTSTSAYFSAGATKTWTIYNNSGSNLNIVPLNK
jgi:hypothetical protein